MKKRSTNPRMAMMMGRAMRRPSLAVPEVTRPAVNPMAAMAAPTMPTMKKGGKLKPIDKSNNPGLSKLPTEVRNKMGYMKNGGCATKSDAKMIAKKEVKGHESSMHKMKKGGITEKGTSEKYKSKAAMMKHEKKESKAEEMKEHGMNRGGKCYASGGKAAQLAKANGIAVKGKSKGRII